MEYEQVKVLISKMMIRREIHLMYLQWVVILEVLLARGMGVRICFSVIL